MPKICSENHKSSTLPADTHQSAQCCFEAIIRQLFASDFFWVLIILIPWNERKKNSTLLLNIWFRPDGDHPFPLSKLKKRISCCVCMFLVGNAIRNICWSHTDIISQLICNFIGFLRRMTITTKLFGQRSVYFFEVANEMWII